MPDRDEQVGEAVAWYYHAVEVGNPPDPNAFLERFPDLRPELESFLADKATFDRIAGPPAATRPDSVAAFTSPADAPMNTAPLPTFNDLSAPPVPADPCLDSVRFIGDHELLGVIARGGMGVVFHARQISLNREVALKMILTGQLAGAADVARFRAEAEAAASLDHPNVLPVYEIGEYGGQQYYTMKFVPGGSLAERIGDLVRDPRAAVAIFVRVCRAVDFAHRRGVLHRDLKPGNVLLDTDGTPFVTDFGLAMKVGGVSNLTRPETIVGTPAYMASEQARAEKALTTAADVYALGAILYELLTGRPPFRGTNALNTVLQVLEWEPKHPRTVNPSADQDLSVVTLKCLAKDPARRYGSAGALADDLDRWARGEPILARPVGSVERAVKWVRRNQGLSAGLAAGVLALVVGTVVAFWQATEARAAAAKEAAQRRVAEDEKIAAVAARTRADSAEMVARTHARRAEAEARRARRLLYAARMHLIQAAWETHDISRVRGLLDAMSPGPGEEDWRGFEWHYWDRLARAELLTLRGSTDEVLFAIFSPNGRTLATGGADRTVRLWDASTGVERLRLPHPKLVRRAAYSPDGKHLATCGEDHTVRVWDPVTGRVVFHRRLPGFGYSVAYAPDGRRLAVGDAGGRVHVWDTTSGEQAYTWRAHTGEPRFGNDCRVLGLAFSSDGARLATASGDRTARVWDLAAAFRKPQLTLSDPAGPVEDVTFAPDGRTLVTASRNGSLKVWDAGTGQELRALTGHSQMVSDLAFSPDGRHLASTSLDRTVRVWDVATGKSLRVLLGHTHFVRSIAYSRDGTRLVTASADRTVKVWDASAGGEAMTLPGRGMVAFTSQGQGLATSRSAEGPGSLWNLATGQRGRWFGAAYWGLSLRPDGARVLAWEAAGVVQVFDTTTGDRRLTWKADHAPLGEGQFGSVNAAVYSPDGRVIATGGEEGAVRLWDAATGRQLRELPIHGRGVTALVYSPDGSRLVSFARDGVVRVWNPTTGLLVRSWTGNATAVLAAVAPGPNGWRLSGYSAGVLRVWDGETGKEVLTLRGHAGGANCAAFSRDGARLATGGGDRTVKVWDSETGQELLTLRGHTTEVTSVAFSPDGRYLASGGEDAVVKVWGATRNRK